MPSSRTKSTVKPTPPLRDFSDFRKKFKSHGPGQVKPFKPGERDFDPTPQRPKPGHAEDEQAE